MNIDEKYPEQNMSKVNATIYEKDNAHDCTGLTLKKKKARCFIRKSVN